MGELPIFDRIFGVLLGGIGIGPHIGFGVGGSATNILERIRSTPNKNLG